MKIGHTISSMGVCVECPYVEIEMNYIRFNTFSGDEYVSGINAKCIHEKACERILKKIEEKDKKEDS